MTQTFKLTQLDLLLMMMTDEEIDILADKLASGEYGEDEELFFTKAELELIDARQGEEENE